MPSLLTGGFEAGFRVRAQLCQAVEDRDRARGRRRRLDHVGQSCGMRPAQRGYVAGARSPGDVRKRSKSSQQGEFNLAAEILRVRFWPLHHEDLVSTKVARPVFRLKKRKGGGKENR